MNEPIQFLQSALISFFYTDARVLPWRENHDPYRIWISEMMLQQTQVKTVIPYYERWMKAYPTLSDLMDASLDDLLKLWQGLGYYSRVRHIYEAAQVIKTDFLGVFPTTYEALLTLPGIGSYSAGAIASMAWDHRHAAVDGNVHRVLSRYFGKPYTKKELEIEMDSILPLKEVGVFNQSLMEIGARRCFSTTTPECPNCPLNSHCRAFIEQKTDELPTKSKPLIKKEEHKTSLIITDGTRFLIQKRSSEGLLAGLWEFPMVEGFLSVKSIQEWLDIQQLVAISIEPKEFVNHIFSHKTWRVQPVLITVSNLSDKPNSGLSITLNELKEHYATSALIQTLLEIIL